MASIFMKRIGIQRLKKKLETHILETVTEWEIYIDIAG